MGKLAVDIVAKKLTDDNVSRLTDKTFNATKEANDLMVTLFILPCTSNFIRPFVMMLLYLLFLLFLRRSAKGLSTSRTSNIGLKLKGFSFC